MFLFCNINCSTFTNHINFDLTWINHFFSRDHRKIAVIDGKSAYIGGINIADYYITGIKGIGEWRDMHSKVEGEAVNDLQRVFLDTWNKETGQDINGEIYFPQQENKGNAYIAVIDRRPGICQCHTFGKGEHRNGKSLFYADTDNT